MRNAIMLRPWLDEMPSAFSRDLFDLRREFDSFFDRVLGAGRTGHEERAWWPSLEQYVEDGNIHVRVDLPGVSPEDVEVTLERDVLTIRGERKSERGPAEGGYREVRYGNFERRLTVPDGIDPGAIGAHYANGILELTLPLPESVKPHKVPVQIGNGAKPQIAHTSEEKAV